MKTAQEYFDEYAVSHQNETNKAIHYICVPLIFFSVIGLLMSIPTTFLENTFGLYNPLLENWAVMVTLFISIFYLRLGFWFFIEMLFVILLCIIGNFWISNNANLFYVSITIFVLAWIGQFYGHKVEGAKPSFLKDLEFLLIGPLWVIQKLGQKK
ncbi:MAG: Mpo1-like protein [Polaribacter sp.]|uniref:Mpo1 family 2-hydroxy fatty acid dioxygenase n=1 Tax=Polaribacter sp. TaxID=1920175 RepID=UPI003BB1ED60